MLNNLFLLNDYRKAVFKLDEVLNLNVTEIIRDSAIKRFEICFDLCWKVLKNYARREGLECNSPRSCFKTAFQLKLIDYDEIWIKMIEDRNLIVHIYNEKYANEIYTHLPGYLEAFKKLLTRLEN